VWTVTLTPAHPRRVVRLCGTHAGVRFGLPKRRPPAVGSSGQQGRPCPVGAERWSHPAPADACVSSDAPSGPRLDYESSRWWSLARCLRSSLCSPPTPSRLTVASATVHVSARDLEFVGSYEPIGDVSYLSATGDDKRATVQETSEGHAVRLDHEGRVTHDTAVNAKWLLDRDGELTATLRDGRQLRLAREDVGDLIA